MKKYIAPVVEVTSFTAEDILVVSGGNGNVFAFANLDAVSDGIEYTGYNG